ncbi:MAG: hypothetical protein BGO43_07780 [Gammaproteobacteria bacterium 39-13]|nr:MAG: hypothetical protein BGO43_07780 [Gammaproteobacteria bacterium 39-13]
MKKDTLTRKITFLLMIKIVLLFCLWKLSFNHPLSHDSRKNGILTLFNLNSYSALSLETTNDR